MVTFSSPLGYIKVIADDKGVNFLQFTDKLWNEEETPLEQEAVKQLQAYFEGRLKRFNLPLNLSEGTSFQQKVWAGLQKIDYGKTISYKELAIWVGNPKACRAVGGANHCNPIAIVVPCHRVVNANGKLGGYAGGLEIKKTLLQLEKTGKIA